VTDSLDRAMKIFRAHVQRDRILSSYKERSRYEKPSDKKRRKRNERQRKLLELERNVQSDDQE
jgi:ribosomal protein S21